MMEERFWLFYEIINKYPSLSYKEEILLLTKMKNGDIEARNVLVYSNLNKIVYIALQYVDQGLEFEDLIQEGVLGFIQALDKYNISYDNRFFSYAQYWVKQSITRAIYDKGRIIRLPVHLCEKIKKLKMVQSKLELTLNRQPTIDDLSYELEMSTEKTRELLRYSENLIQFDEFIDENGETTLSIIEEDKNPSPEDILHGREISKTTDKVLGTLLSREAEVIRLRFGFDNGHPKTLEEIGKKLNLTRERIRQIEAKALRKLRHPTRSRKLKECFDYTFPVDNFNMGESGY